ncbi:triose-phosphate isomerase [Agromyces atrinae]|uniref:triose-phosphate isomerase family protein n=1 Tax=Agromyces atrinae TaxID=592376 RepID=UPI001F5ADDF5|nr:triose-phosphate isomerase family protein [Agromyces atrinae]MCI2958435.1 triose-phosphate isomerase [Agromyces atrinae]
MSDSPGSGAASPSRTITLGVSLKMYLGVDQAAEWADAVALIASTHDAVRSGAVRLFVLPSLPATVAVSAKLGDSPVAWGAQDLHWDDRGAVTGGTSGADLVELGCTLVEVGHAERRKIFGEDAGVTRRKFAAATRNGLTPVLCVGEREPMPAADAAAECIAQLESAFAGDRGSADVIVAYEPEWAIGQPQPAPPEHVRAVADIVRDHLASTGGTAGETTLIYGGSAGIGTLSSLGDSVDGLFLGRFAHNPADFARIIDDAAALT